MKKVALLFICCISQAQAHLPEDSYLYLRDQPEGLTLIWDIAAGNINELLPLDADDSGNFEESELFAKEAEILAIADNNLEFSQNGASCRKVASPLGISNYTSGAHASIKYLIECPEQDEINIRYTLMHGVESGHRGILLYNWVEGNAARFEFIEGRASFAFTPQTMQPNTVVADGEPVVASGQKKTSWLETFKTYVVEGIWHIWAGIDHVLFIITLLLPAALIWRGSSWQPVGSARTALVETVKIVTAFTLAHSITLTLASLGWVSIPARLTESVIAFSVLVVALNNIRPFIPVGRWSIAFAFGLLHGFGFAYVLADLGLYQGGLVASLAGFNVGVEIGQLVIVLLLLPVLYLLRNTLLYRQRIMPLASLIIGLIALVWMIERITGNQWLGF